MNGESNTSLWKTDVKPNPRLSAKAAKSVADATLEGVLRVGQWIDGEGVFIGTWEPPGADGRKLGKTFNLFAAPEDLKNSEGEKLTLTFDDAVRKVAGLKGWNGHDGGNFENDQVLYKAFETGMYNGEWFIPPLEILGRKDAPPAHNLYVHKDWGVLAGTFTTMGAMTPIMYWSSTRNREDPERMDVVYFAGGSGVVVDRDRPRLSCRVVRAVPRIKTSSP